MSKPGLIVTADDFGLSVEVNEAVEEAHRNGVLTSASLVVAGEAAEDAVRRARKMPKLGVGLHLALLDAPSALPAGEIPDLYDPKVRGLDDKPALTGAKIALMKSVREQARAEMRAQFEGFTRTGLKLDHVDGHWHFHQHPTLTAMLVKEMAPRYGVKAVRIPREPPLASWRAAGRKGLWGRIRTAAGHAVLWARMRHTLTKAGIGANDWFFGLNDGGNVTRDLLIGMIENLPDGVSEIGLHPASGPLSGPFAPPASWKVTEELAGLTDPDVKAAAERVRLGNFSELVA